MQNFYFFRKEFKKNKLALTWLMACFFMLSSASVFGQLTYCTTSNAGGGGSFINQVDFNTISNNSASSQPSSPYYTYYSSVTTSVTMGTSVNLTITTDPASTYSGAIVSVWFDWNQDGTLSASEWTQVGTNIVNSSPATVAITIPVTATPGLTRMRIRSRGTGNPNGSGDACTSMGSGETEDYDITVVPATVCSGTPTAGTAVASSNPACPNQTYSVSLSGATIASGLTYDWQASPVGMNSWTSVGSGYSYSTTMTSGGNMDYRCVLSCGTALDTSTTITVTANAFYNCYCSPLNGTTLNSYGGTNYITSVAIPTTTLSNSTSSAGSGGYTQYSPTVSTNTDTLWPGMSYTINVGYYYPYSYEKGGAWIDWDMSGTFDTSELITLTNTSTGGTGTFTVPLSATAGSTGFRVRVNDWGNTYGQSHGACDDDFGGETEDYMITIAALTACSGQPNAATVSGDSSACSGSSFTLSASNMTLGLGITYDWQSNDGSGWISTGGTATTYTASSGITIATSYRLITYCSNSNMYDTSNVFPVALSPFYECYCSPLTGTTLASSYSSNYITNVAVVTSAISNSTSSSGSGGYTQYPASVTTDTLWPGMSYTLNVGFMYPYGYDQGAGWIDWDQNGVFDTSELIALTTNSTGGSATFSVPLTATAGATGFRVRVNDWGNTYSATHGACDDDFYGETEDYVVTIATLPTCSGQPNAATVSGDSTACSGIDFTLSASNMTLALGITYDWQSNDGSGWVSTGGTGTTYTASGGITIATSYRLITYCSNSNMYDTSNAFPVALSPFYECYCSPLNGTTLASSSYLSNYITSVAVVTSAISNSTSTQGPGGYTQYPASVTTDTLWPGMSYTLNVGFLYPSWDYGGAWIDWDQNGTFDTGELITLTNNSTGASGAFTVPLTATAGMTGFRVRVNDYGNTYSATHGACDDDNYGETEDYVVTIATLPTCSGQPNAATVSGDSSVCSGISFTLSASNMTLALGIVYDWQSNDGTGWVSTGGTATTYTASGGITVATSYRLITYCSNSGMYDTSNAFPVSISPFYECYCSPLNGTTLASSSYLSNYITSVAVVTSAISNSTSTQGSGGYTQYPASVTTDTLFPGMSYTLNVGFLYPTWDDGGAWIDWDQNGTFDTGELITLTNNATGASGAFTVPLTATAGMTGFRVRVNDYGNTYSATHGACDNDYYGETEDYVVTIATLIACSGQPSATTISGPAGSCTGVNLVLSASGMSIGLGITYDWQSNTGSGWASTGVTTTSDTVIGGLSVPTSFRMITYCSNSGMYDTSNVLAVGVNSFYQCYCVPVGTSYTYYGVNNFSTTGGWTNISNLNTGVATGGYADYSSTMSVSTSIGSSVGIAASGVGGGSYTYGWAVWVDWNKDGDFADVGETVYNSTSYISSIPANTSFTVPALDGNSNPVDTGNRKMRIIADYFNSNPSNNYCSSSNSNYAEWEDYNLNITTPPACAPPTALSASSVTATGATITWTSGGTSEVLEYGPTGYTPGTGATAGTGGILVSPATSPATLTGLSANTSYTVYIRQDCTGAGNGYSPNAQVSFYTLPLNDTCGGATAITLNAAPIIDNNAAATTDPLPGVTCGSSSSSTGTSYGLWYTFTAPYTGNFTFSGCGAAMDDYARIYTGACGAMTTCVGYNDDGCYSSSPSGPYPIYTFAGTSGTTYYILIGTYSSGSGTGNIYAQVYTPLAIKMDKLSAVNVGTSNRVEWNTLSEEKGDEFFLQRSANGQDFETIYTKAANGSASRYTYMDNMPLQGMNYYRLRMKEANGSVSYSEIVKAYVKGGNFAVQAYPNPVSDELTVSVSGVQGNDAQVQVTDITGKVVKTVKMSGSQVRINMHGLANGIYLIKYADNNHTETLRISKQ